MAEPRLTLARLGHPGPALRPSRLGWLPAAGLTVWLLALGVAVFAANGGRVLGRPPEASVLLIWSAPPGDGALALARLPGVAGVQLLSEAELRQRLQPWLGDLTALGPLPSAARLIPQPGSDPEALARAAERASPGARAAVLADWRARLNSERGASQRLALAALASACGLALVLGASAARIAAQAAAPTLRIWHGLGALPGTLARSLFTAACAPAALGAILGGITAPLAIAALLGGGGDAAAGNAPADAAALTWAPALCGARIAAAARGLGLPAEAACLALACGVLPSMLVLAGITAGALAALPGALRPILAADP